MDTTLCVDQMESHILMLVFVSKLELMLAIMELVLHRNHGKTKVQDQLIHGKSMLDPIKTTSLNGLQVSLHGKESIYFLKNFKEILGKLSETILDQV